MTAAKKKAPIARTPAPPRQRHDRADDYLGWLAKAVTPHHAVAVCADVLERAGFQPQLLAANFEPRPGDRRYVVHPDGKSLIALVIGERSPVDTGFALIGAHTDSPDLRLRLNPVASSAGALQLTTQLHGGLIRRSWLDRPLGLAGVAYEVVRDRHGAPTFHPVTGVPVLLRRLLRIDEPIAIIPDLAIHLDRDKNDKGGINPQNQLNAVLAGGDLEQPEVLRLLSTRAGLDLDRVDGFDLHLVPVQKPMRAGIDGSLIVGGRHDDLAMVYAGLSALLESVEDDPNPVRTRVAAFFDAEETGSLTSSGAASSFLRDVLVRTTRRHPATDSAADAEQAFAHTVCLSADMAHAQHPAHPELHDKQHAPLINRGVVLKANTNDRYATTGETGALFTALCEAAGAPIQDFVMRQDLACGSTIGPITSASLAARTVDIGCPMWAMHSSAETMGAQDLDSMVDVMRTFFAGRKA
jgi:aspartyl aminopeptidase